MGRRAKATIALFAAGYVGIHVARLFYGTETLAGEHPLLEDFGLF